jgi:hypothetical protein
MSQIHRIAAIAAVFSFAAGAYAADDKNKSNDDGRICTLESVVGSHMPKRVCTTAAQRDATRAASQQRVNEYQNYANRSSMGSSSPGR